MKPIFASLALLGLAGLSFVAAESFTIGTSTSTVQMANANVGTLTLTNGLTSIDVGTLYLSNMVANIVPVFDGNTNMVSSTTSTNDIYELAGKAILLHQYLTNTIQGSGPVLLKYEIAATPSLGASGTNIVVDYSYRRLRLATTTNMNIASFANEAPAGYGAGCLLKLFANGGNVIVNMGATAKIANSSVAFPVTITNGDWGVFSFDNSETGTNGVAYSYVH